jgi:GH15 family glucan-1,4-alpha-glucosidase
MGRPVVLSNGQLFVGLDESGLVHDFYYPYVGLDNLTNARSSQHKIGVWAGAADGSDGEFHWTNDASWKVDIAYQPHAMMSRVHMQSEKLGVSLDFQDFVDPEYNAFVRQIKITNDRDDERDIRLFMHQVFQISRAGRADTAMYVPDDDYILDYKGRCCLLIAGKKSKPDEDGQEDKDSPRDASIASFDQYSVGNYAIEGKAGTFMDAEDGELSGNAVEHGGVDSVLRFRNQTAGKASFVVDYWIVAADSQTDAQVIHTYLKYYPVSERLAKAQDYWKGWLEAGKDKVPVIAIDETKRTEVETSLLVIKAHCDSRGSILASGDSSIFNYGRDYYCYCWPRDAAYALWPLIRLGHFDEAKRFFEFARDTMHRDGYLMHKYQPDRAIGSTWHPLVHGRNKELAIQEDETAIVVYMIGEYYKRSQDKAFVLSFYDTFVTPCADFMTHFIDKSTGLPHASYDLWEQKFQTSTYTVSTVIAGLETAAFLAEAVDHPDDAIRWRRVAEHIRGSMSALYHPDGYFRKGFLLQENGDLQYDDTLDISNLYGPYMFSGLAQDDAMVTSTLKHVEEKLLNTSPIGGVIRFPGDGYFLGKSQYPGNPWIVCTLWLAQMYLSGDRIKEARDLISWAEQRALPSGSLSEQFDPENGFAIGVTPLVWSHAEFINTVLDLQNRS